MRNEFNLTPYRTESAFVQHVEPFRRYRHTPAVLASDPAEILLISSFPPRECGIATYSQDLIKAMKAKYGSSFSIRICALESANEHHLYPPEVKYLLDTDCASSFARLANVINQDPKIKIVLLQHEFGFYKNNRQAFLGFLEILKIPLVIVFHTVLPRPDKKLRREVRMIAGQVASIIAMTNASVEILVSDYRILRGKIRVIQHGTHPVPYADREGLKLKYGFSGRRLLSNFGLLSSGKSIETALYALVDICAAFPDVLFLIISKTHPGVIKEEGEIYREKLESLVDKLGLGRYVRFINSFLPLDGLLEYLQATEIYLFTSNNPNQAVSGTFAYAMSCGCAVVSTPIPHALELLGHDSGIIVDFNSPVQLAEAVIGLLSNPDRVKRISSNSLGLMASTVWENSAIVHADALEEFCVDGLSL